MSACAEQEMTVSVIGLGKFKVPNEVEISVLSQNDGSSSIIMLAQDNGIWRANNLSSFYLQNVNEEFVEKSSLAQSIIENMTKSLKGKIIEVNPFSKVSVSNVNYLFSHNKIAFVGFVGRIDIYGYYKNAGMCFLVFVSADGDCEYWKILNKKTINSVFLN